MKSGPKPRERAISALAIGPCQEDRMDMNEIMPVGTLRQLLKYNPETGRLHWRPRDPSHFGSSGKRSPDALCANWNSRYAAKEALFYVGSHGYRCGSIMGKSYLAHRVIMAMERGCWDFRYVDHVNGDTLDNRIENLRVATNGQNIANSRSRIGATSRYLGVARHTQNGNWIACITKDGHQKHIGVFAEEADAAKAYNEAAKRTHGEFARLNII